MPQIIATSRALPTPPAAGGPEPLPGDGFETLLAGLLGIAVAPPVPMELARPLNLQPATPPEPDAEATGAADAGTASPENGADDQPPLARPPLARPPVQPPAAAAGPAATETTAPPQPQPQPQAAGGEPARAGARPATPAETAPGAAPAPADHHRPGAAEPRSPVAERQPPPAAAEPPTTAGSVPAKRESARPTAPARPSDPGPATDPARHADPRRLPADAVALRPEPADRPVLLGPLVAGSRGNLAQFGLVIDWRAPIEADAGRGLAPVAAGPAPLDAISAEAAPARAAPPPPVRQLAAAIERAVGGDVQRLTVQLSPQALGSIEIALEFDAERRLAVVILAERPETLELLRGEARELQRLLAQQGIDLAGSGLELGLMSGERRQRQPGADDDAPPAEGEVVELETGAVPAAELERHPLDPVGRNGRLNLSI